jgi:hypothetical protein
MVFAGELDMLDHGPAAPEDSEYSERYEEIADPLLAVVANHDSEIPWFRDAAVMVPTCPGTARG